MKKIITLPAILIIAISQLSCGILLNNLKPKQELPFDKTLNITEHETDKKQRLFLSLFDPADSLIYLNYRIKPDSIICIIDSRIQTPTLKINEVYVQHIERRYNDYETQHEKDRFQPGTSSFREPPITISYLESILIYCFTFPSIKDFELWIPENLRKKANIKTLKPPKLEPEKKAKKVYSIRPYKGAKSVPFFNTKKDD